MWHFGQMGVIIFFVHTSLVLMLSLERQEARGQSLYRDFYMRRFFRIYPLSMFCVTVAFLLNANMHDPTKHWTWGEYLSNMTLTMNLFYVNLMVGALWTLPLEVQMYIALPFLFVIARYRPLWLMAGLWLLAVVAGIVQPNITGRLNVLEYGPCFVAGVAGWRLSRSVPRSIPGWAWPAAFIALWPLFLIATRDHDMYYRWAFCLALGLAIPWFQEMRLGLLNRAAHVIAKYSYGIYLGHGAVLMVAFLAPVPAVVQFAIIGVGIVAVPFLMYHMIEQPMIRFGQKVVARRRNRGQAELVPAG